MKTKLIFNQKPTLMIETSEAVASNVILNSLATNQLIVSSSVFNRAIKKALSAVLLVMFSFALNNAKAQGTLVGWGLTGICTTYTLNYNCSDTIGPLLSAGYSSQNTVCPPLVPTLCVSFSPGWVVTAHDWTFTATGGGGATVSGINTLGNPQTLPVPVGSFLTPVNYITIGTNTFVAFSVNNAASTYTVNMTTFSIVLACGTGTTSTGCCLGNYCSSSQNQLTGNYQIPMNGFNFNFTTPTGSKSQVLIGYPNCNASVARLDVLDNAQGNAIKGYCSTNGQNNIGVHGEAFDPNFPGNGLTTIGVLGEVNARVPQNYAAGVAGFSGGPAVLNALPVGQNIGVYGNSKANGGTWAGYFDGEVGFNGNALPIGACSWNLGLPGSEWNEVWACNGTIQTSDKRKKDNIQSLSYGIKEIMKLNPVSFNWKSNSSGTRKIGFIAQELREVISEVVKEGTDENKTLGVNYAELSALLVKGMQEQQILIEDQQREINVLKQESAEMKKQISNITGINNFNAIETGIQMSQNEPNPFTHETLVKYTLPQTVSNAFMAVYDLTGKQITTFPIDQKGSASIVLTSEKLAAGIYIYSIVADGKVMDSKRMIVAEK